MKEKILIIGNEAVFINALLAKLSADKFAVLMHNGASEINEIILFIKQNRPDYIIQTLALPRNNGFDLLKKIKSDDIISAIPLFIAADLENKEIKESCLNSGANYFIAKSRQSIDDFVLKIKKIINNRKKIK